MIDDLISEIQELKNPIPQLSFLMGSQVYGNPSEDSDVDLAIRISWEEAQKLALLSDTGGFPLRFGRLNFLCCYTDDAFRLFNDITRELKARSKTRPVTRDEAIEAFRNESVLRNVNIDYDEEGAAE